jgi:tetratricopeptide (TPR) repeat protein
MERAIKAIKQAIRLDPKYAPAHNHLGIALYAKGDVEGAIACLKQAIRLDPKNAPAHSDLGVALKAKGDVEGAIACYKQAIRLDPNNAMARANLSRAQHVRELLLRLPDVLADKDNPNSPGEACDFARLCAEPFQRRYAAAVRLFEGAFAGDPKLAEDLAASHRYEAACCAALAGCGQGKEAARRDDKENKRLREQALTWLQADLKLHRQNATSTDAARRQSAAAMLTHWLADPDFTGVRAGPGRVAIAAQEQAAWDALWSDVKATLALTRKPPAAAPRK